MLPIQYIKSEELLPIHTRKNRCCPRTPNTQHQKRAEIPPVRHSVGKRLVATTPARAVVTRSGSGAMGLEPWTPRKEFERRSDELSDTLLRKRKGNVQVHEHKTNIIDR